MTIGELREVLRGIPSSDDHRELTIIATDKGWPDQADFLAYVTKAHLSSGDGICSRALIIQCGEGFQP